MMLYEYMDKEDLYTELKGKQEYMKYMVENSPGEGYIISKTQEQIDKLQKLIKNFGNTD